VDVYVTSRNPNFGILETFRSGTIYMKTIEIQLEDQLVDGDDLREVSTQIREDRIVRKYLAGDLSIGGVAELMDMRIGQARDWLHSSGVATMRKMSPEMEATAKSNMDLPMALKFELKKSSVCKYKKLIHFHSGFLLERGAREIIISQFTEPNSDIICPYLI
jgi:hypothetical protein